MMGYVLTVAMGCVFHTALAPQLDYAQIPAPEGRPHSYVHVIEIRTASGLDTGLRSEVVLGQGPQTGPEISKWSAWGFGEMCLSFEFTAPRITLLAWNGDPVVFVQTQGTGIDREGNRIEMPGAAVRWVPRTPPRPRVTTTLSAGPAGGGVLGRGASAAFEAVVTAVAAPELDFGALPPGPQRPRAYTIWVQPLLASGDPDGCREMCPVGLWGDDRPARQVVERAAGLIGRVYDLRLNSLDSRLALFAHVQPVNGAAQYERVIGLSVESDGPVPALRWTLRPEVRALLDKK